MSINIAVCSAEEMEHPQDKQSFLEQMWTSPIYVIGELPIRQQIDYNGDVLPIKGVKSLLRCYEYIMHTTNPGKELYQSYQRVILDGSKYFFVKSPQGNYIIKTEQDTTLPFSPQTETEKTASAIVQHENLLIDREQKYNFINKECYDLKPTLHRSIGKPTGSPYAHSLYKTIDDVIYGHQPTSDWRDDAGIITFNAPELIAVPREISCA